jgi:hypothetical protein
MTAQLMNMQVTLYYREILVSKYSHFAGGLTVGQYQSFNNYSKPEVLLFPVQVQGIRYLAWL